VERDTIEIDTPEDAEALERYLGLHPESCF